MLSNLYVEHSLENSQCLFDDTEDVRGGGMDGCEMQKIVLKSGFKKVQNINNVEINVTFIK